MADVNIVIEAQDKASVVLEKVAKSVEDNVKQIRSTGEATKKSTELIGTFANALGDTGLGSFTGQFAALTEKASAFSETMKDGAGNSLAFKAGLVGLAGVIGFSVGKAIGDAIFQTERWKDELAALGEESKRLAGALNTVADRRFALIQEEIQLFTDPEDQERAALDALQTIEKEISRTRKSLSREFDEEAQGLDPWFGSAADRAEIKKQFEESQQELQGNLERLKSQAQALRDQTSERQKNIDATKAQNAENAKSQSYIANLQQEVELLRAKKGELNEITAVNNTSDLASASLAQRLLDERDALKAASEHAKEMEKITAELQKQLDIETLGADAAKEKEQLAIAANDAEKARIELLQRQVSEQKRLNEAAKDREKQEAEAAKKAMEDAKKLAEEEQKRQEEIENFKPGTTATESRTLTRGPATSEAEKKLDVERTGITLAKQKEELALSVNIAEQSRIGIIREQIELEKQLSEEQKNRLRLLAPASERIKTDDLSDEQVGVVRSVVELKPRVPELLTRAPDSTGMERVAKNTEATVREVSLLRQDMDRKNASQKLQLEFVA